MTFNTDKYIHSFNESILNNSLHHTYDLRFSVHSNYSTRILFKLLHWLKAMHTTVIHSRSKWKLPNDV